MKPLPLNLMDAVKNIDHFSTHDQKLRQGIPNVLLRSGLFGMEHQAEYYVDTTIPVQKGYALVYSGPALTPYDARIWYTIVTTALEYQCSWGEPFQMKISQWLTFLYGGDTGPNRTSLQKSLAKLRKAWIAVTTPDCSVHAPLLGSLADKESIDDPYLTMVHRDLRPLFDQDIARVDLRQRAKLQSPLSMWLFDFYSSHSITIPVDIDYIMALLCIIKPRFKFKSRLKSCLDELICIDFATTSSGFPTPTSFTLFKKTRNIVIGRSTLPKSFPIKMDTKSMFLTLHDDPDMSEESQFAQFREGATDLCVLTDDVATGGRTSAARIFAITTNNFSKGFEDFEHRLARDGLSVHAVVRMGPVPCDKITVTGQKALLVALQRLFSKHKPRPNDVLAIVRGGGSMESFAPFNDPETCVFLHQLRQQYKVRVVTGVGHSGDPVLIDHFVTHPCSLPYHAAETVVSLSFGMPVHLAIPRVPSLISNVDCS